jgi:hypothetical protein
MSDKARRWLHNTRGSDGHEDRASRQRIVDSIQFKRHFAKPADVRAIWPLHSHRGISAGGS